MISNIIFAIICQLFFQHSQATSADCLYVQQFTFFDGINIATRRALGPYQFTVVWQTPQYNIINSSFALAGFKMGTIGLPLSYEASLTNTNPIWATFSYNPFSNSQIMKVTFLIILLKYSGYYIQMQFIDFYPTILSNPIRTTENFQRFNVSVGFTFTPPVSKYQFQIFLSAVEHTAPSNKRAHLSLLPKPIVAGQDYHTIEVFSLQTLSNGLAKISVTYILFDTSNVSSKISYFNTPYQKTAIVNVSFSVNPLDNFNIPADFNPYLSQKCITSIKSYITFFLQSPLLMDYTYSNSIYTNYSSLTVNNFGGFNYTAFCLYVCPQNHFIDSILSTFICYPCSHFAPHCQVCLLQQCFRCLPGYYLLNSTNQCLRTCPNGFYANSTSRICQNCQNSTSLGYVNGQCICIGPNYSLVAGICSNLIGCITPQNNITGIICLFCNPILHFQLLGYYCKCKDGFQLEVTSCKEVCGDGRLFDLDCDDGNIIDGDGCSSVCITQKYYKCENGSQFTPSVCRYLLQNIVLSVVRIDKNELSNRAIFKFTFSPFLYNMNKLNLTKDIDFKCNQSFAINKTTIEMKYLIIEGQFFEDLQGNEANLTVFLSNNFFTQTKASINFRMISSGLKLILIKNKQYLQVIKIMVYFLSVMAMLIFIVSISSHNMIGIELVHSLQVIYFVQLINKSYTLPYSLLKYLAYSVYDFASIANSSGTSFYTEKSSLEFDIYRLSVTLSIIFGLSAALIPLSIFGWFISFKQQEQIKQIMRVNMSKIEQKPSQRGKFINQNIVFPISMSFFMVLLLVFNQKDRTLNPSFFQYLLCPQFLFMSIVFFSLWMKIIYPKFNHLKNQSYHPGYVSFYLTLFLSVTIVLRIALHNASFHPEFFLLVFYMLAFILQIVFMPYKSTFHNFSVLWNFVVVLIFLLWSGLKSSQMVSQDQSTEALIVLVMIVVILASNIVSIIRLVIEFKKTYLRLETSKNGSSLIPIESLKEKIECREALFSQREHMSIMQMQSFKAFLANPIIEVVHAGGKATVETKERQRMIKEAKLKVRSKYELFKKANLDHRPL